MKDNDNSHKVVFFFKCHKNVFEEAKLFEVLSLAKVYIPNFFYLQKSRVSKLYSAHYYPFTFRNKMYNFTSAHEINVLFCIEK